MISILLPSLLFGQSEINGSFCSSSSCITFSDSSRFEFIYWESVSEAIGSGKYLFYNDSLSLIFDAKNKNRNYDFEISESGLAEKDSIIIQLFIRDYENNTISNMGIKIGKKDSTEYLKYGLNYSIDKEEYLELSIPKSATTIWIEFSSIGYEPVFQKIAGNQNSIIRGHIDFNKIGIIEDEIWTFSVIKRNRKKIIISNIRSPNPSIEYIKNDK